MSNKKYALTISVLASNRKDTFLKTLESIKPILDNVSSELIVVDTGCDEELLEVIRQYTDKIVKFQWCRDFSKARNAGLEKSQGQWFMYIDDDEWFEDVSEIINFFNTKEHEKYGYAKYRVRNYRDKEGTSWLDTMVGRMFQINQGTRFVDAIHEKPVNIVGPVKIFDSYVHHYGYVYKNEQERNAHLERNISLLRKQIEREPKTARHYAQLAQEYCAAGAGDEAMNVALSGIDNVDVLNEDNHKDLPGLYAVVVWNYLNNMRNEQAVEKAKEYMKSGYCNKLCEAMLCGFCAVAEYRIVHYKESIGFAERFFDIKKYFEEHVDERHSQATVMLIYALEEENCRNVAKVANASVVALDKDKNRKYAKDRKCAVTISILASNRKDTLQKTLESIKPILDNVSSELIVTDTGCDEDLLEIIRRYTNNIIKFDWCRDFSKARNVGLKKAQGEWFLYIDDDEWFEDVSEIVAFFNSTERHKYGTGRYYQRNYKNFEGTAWGDFSAGRMFRIYEDTRFIDAIHERPINVPGAVKHFEVFAHHYGYVYKDKEEEWAKHERNLSLLLKQSETEPHVARHYAHIAQEYGAACEYEKIEEIAKNGIANSDMTNVENCVDVGGLYAIDVWAMLNMGRYEDVLNKAGEYLKSPYCNKLCGATLYGFCTTAAYRLKQYEACIKYAKDFFELGDYLLANPDDRYTLISVVLVHALDRDNYDRVATAGMVASTNIRDVAMVEFFMSYLDFNRVFVVPDVECCMENTLGMMLEDKVLDRYVCIAEKLLKNSYTGNELLRAVIRLRDNNMQEFLQVAGVMGKTSSDIGYVQYLRIIDTYRSGATEKLEELYRKAIAAISDILYVNHEFWAIAATCNIDIDSMLCGKPLAEWMACVDKWSRNIKIKELIEKKQDLDNVMKPISLHMRYFNMIFAELLLYRKKLDDISIERLKQEMRCYSDTVLDFYKELYTSEVFEKYRTILPDRCLVAIEFRRICEDSTYDVKACRQEILRYAKGLEKLIGKYIELNF